MLIEAIVTLVGIACSSPALVTELREEFDAGDWSTWVKLMPQILLLLSLGMRGLRKVLWMSLILSVMGLLTTYFCLLFNSRASASVVCEGYSSACADDGEATCSGVPLEPWEGLFYLVGLCFMTIGSTILIRDTSLKLKEPKVNPA